MSLGDVVPWWVGWLGPIVFVALILTWVFLVPWLVLALIGREITPDQHWTTRAALSTEGRLAIMAAVIVWPILSVGTVSIFVGPFTNVSRLVLTVFSVVFVWAVVVAMARDFSGKLGQPTSPLLAHYWRLLRIWWPLGALVLIGFLAPARLSSPWMIPWTITAVAALALLRYLPDVFVLTGVAKPAERRVLDAVAGASRQCGIQPPRAIVLDSFLANAAAISGRNLVVATRRLVDELNDEELEAVMIHEIAHLEETRSITRQRIFSSFTLLPFLAVRPLWDVSPIVFGVAVVAAFAINHVISQMVAREETRADESVLAVSHESTVFGEALSKIYESALIPASTKRDPHGPLYDRLVRAGIDPDFGPEVARPRKMRLIVAGVVSILALLVAVIVPIGVVDVWDGGTGSHVAIAFGSNTAEVLGWTGYLRADEGDFETAIVYLDEAVSAGDQPALVDLAWSLAALGDCERASALMPRIEAADIDSADVIFASFMIEDCLLDL